MKKIILTINGMDCKHCVNHIEEELHKAFPTGKIKVHLHRKEAIVQTDSEVEDQELEKLISNIGYTVVDIKRK